MCYLQREAEASATKIHPTNKIMHKF